MTRLHEVPSNQVLTEARAKNIGSFYLTSLLRTLQEGKEKADWDPHWGSINSDLSDHFLFINNKLRNIVNIEIPPLLAEALGFSELKWQVKKESVNSHLSTLLLGHEPEIDGKVSIDQALATMEITQRTIAGEKDYFGQVYEPLFLRVAGKGIAATYNLTDNNRLTELNIFLPIDESINLSETRFRDREMYRHFNIVDNLMTTLPTDTDRPYETAGLITGKMCKKDIEMIPKLSPVYGNYKPEAIVVRFPRHDYTVMGKPRNPSMKDNLLMLTRDLGYYATEEKGPINNDVRISVGLKESVAQKRELLSWRISVPKFLPKAQSSKKI